MPDMNGEKFPYPQSGVQPAAMDKLYPATSMISGGANDIYSPEVPDVASTSIYLTAAAPVGGGANDVNSPNPPKTSGGANDIYLRDNETV
jgi:hypothetical protein|tara:strand:- start:288 stop:557 length:270 start_codon:yes stop_codon:yes gene_type:complete